MQTFLRNNQTGLIARRIRGVLVGSDEEGCTVEVDGAAPFFRAQCDDVTFLGD